MDGLLYYHDVANPAWGSIPGYSLRTVHWRNALVDVEGGPCANTVYRCLYFVISMEAILRSRSFQNQGVRFSKLLRIVLGYENRIWTHAGSSEEYGRIMSSPETFSRDWNTMFVDLEEQIDVLQHCDRNLHLLHEACELAESGNFPGFHELLAWWPILPQPYRKLLEPWWLQQFQASSSSSVTSRPQPAAAAGLDLIAVATTTTNVSSIDFKADNHFEQLPLHPHHHHLALHIQPIHNQKLHLFSKMITSHHQQQQHQQDHHQPLCTNAPPASFHHQKPSTRSFSTSLSSSSSSSLQEQQSRQNCSGLISSSSSCCSSPQEQQFRQNSSGNIPSSSISFQQQQHQKQQFGQESLGTVMDCDILACEIYMSLRHVVENGGGGDAHSAGPSLSLLKWGMITEGRVIDSMQYLLHQQPK